MLDVLRPGPMLAEVADAAHVHGLPHAGDDELAGIIKAWRRITSWAAARELAAIAEPELVAGGPMRGGVS